MLSRFRLRLFLASSFDMRGRHVFSTYFPFPHDRSDNHRHRGGILLSAHVVILKQVQNFAYPFGPRGQQRIFLCHSSIFSLAAIAKCLANARTTGRFPKPDRRIPPWENKPLMYTVQQGASKQDEGCRHTCLKKKTAGRKLNGNFCTRSLNPFRIGSHASAI